VVLRSAGCVSSPFGVFACLSGVAWLFGARSARGYSTHLLSSRARALRRQPPLDAPSPPTTPSAGLLGRSGVSPGRARARCTSSGASTSRPSLLNDSEICPRPARGASHTCAAASAASKPELGIELQTNAAHCKQTPPDPGPRTLSPERTRAEPGALAGQHLGGSRASRAASARRTLGSQPNLRQSPRASSSRRACRTERTSNVDSETIKERERLRAEPLYIYIYIYHLHQ